MNNNVKRICIIGAGPTGIAVYLEAVREMCNSLVEIKIIDSQGLMSSFSFNPQLESALTNTSIATTSIYSHDQMDLFKWTQDKIPHKNYTPNSFIPRKYVRNYILDRFEQAKEFADIYECKTIFISSKAEMIIKKGESLIVVDDKDNKHHCDAVIIATGISLATNRLPEKIQKVSLPPYPESDYLNLLKDNSKVLIFGSKLSAIDTAIAINNYNPTCQVNLVSPSGKLPKVRDTLTIHSLKLGGKSIRKYLEKLIEKINDDREFDLAFDINNCKQSTDCWQTLIGVIVEKINQEWPTYTLEEKESFRIEYKEFLSRYVSAFPLENAQRIMKMIKRNDLYITSINKDSLNDNNYLNLLLNGYHVIIDATGVNKINNNTIINDLMKYGVKKNKRGGIVVNSDTLRIICNENELNIYGAGPVLEDEFLVLNYIRTSTIHAGKIITNIKAVNGKHHSV